MEQNRSIPRQVLQRLPNYLSYLKGLSKEGPANISATTIANGLGLNQVQVRKDLAMVCSGGRPKIGYITEDLIAQIEHFLGYDDVRSAVLIGVGHLGRALLSYRGFEQYGLEIVAAFDTDEDLIDTEVSGKRIFPLSKLKDLRKRLGVHIGILAVPEDCAQGVCDLLIESGILAVWNFAPVHLKGNKDVLIQNENMAASLAVLSTRLAERLADEDY